MKTATTRPAVSQSLDLFIIIGVVLAVGGVVASSAAGLIGAASSVPSLQLVSFSLLGTPAGTVDGGATLSLILKNAGASTVMVGSAFSISVATNSITTFTAGDCTAGTPTSFAGADPVTYTPSVVGSCASGALKGLSWVGPAAPVPLAPGQQLTFVATAFVTGASGAIPNLITTGQSYQMTAVGNGQSIVQNVVSE